MFDPDLSDIDLLDLDRWERDGAPYDQFAHLRDVAPVWRHPSRTDDGRPGFWVVSGYDEVFGLSRCPHAMSSDGDLGGVVGLGPGDELQNVQDRFVEITGGRSFTGDQAVLATLDPPEHTAYRSLVNRGFTPRAVRHLEDGVASIVGRLLDRHPTGVTYDFTTEVAMPVPMTVIADLLGAPPEMHADIVRLTNQARRHRSRVHRPRRRLRGTGGHRRADRPLRPDPPGTAPGAARRPGVAAPRR